MAKGANPARSTTLRLTLSEQSLSLLDQLVLRGIYGRNPAEVAARFVDAALQEYVEKPRLDVPPTARNSSTP
jgi:hypothetical protein